VFEVGNRWDNWDVCWKVKIVVSGPLVLHQHLARRLFRVYWAHSQTQFGKVFAREDVCGVVERRNED